MRDLIDKAPLLKKVLNMGPKIINRPPCQDIVLQGDDIDLTTLRSKPAGQVTLDRSSRGHWSSLAVLKNLA